MITTKSIENHSTQPMLLAGQAAYQAGGVIGIIGTQAENSERGGRVGFLPLLKVADACELRHRLLRHPFLKQLLKQALYHLKSQIRFGVGDFQINAQRLNLGLRIIAHSVRPLVGVSESSGGDTLAFPSKGRPSGEVAA